MQEPICQKCGDWLEHSETSYLWICKGCGSKYIYKEPFPNNELLLLQQMGGKIEACEEQIISASEQFESVLLQLNSFCLENSSLSEYIRNIGESIEVYRHGMNMLQDSFSGSNQLIEELQSRCTPMGGGHFEIID